MDLQQLLGDQYKEGMTLEEINTALSEKTFVDSAALPKSVTKEQFDKTASELASVKKELNTIKSTSLTAEEQMQAKMKEVDETRQSLAKERSLLKATQIFTEAGLSEKDFSSVLGSVVNEDFETTLGAANAMVTLIKTQKANVEKAVREELLRTTPTPPGGNGGVTRNFEKEIADAQNANNPALAAALIRQQNELKK